MKNSKKGAVLAYVIIISAAMIILAAMAVSAANASIGTAYNGIRSREAYLNAKSGIEYAKVISAGLRNEITEQLNTSPGSITALPAAETRYAYYSEEDGFHSEAGISGTDPDFRSSPIQLTYVIEHQVAEIPTENEDEIKYDYNMLIDFTSVGKSIRQNSLFDWFSSKGTMLKYRIEPLKGAVVIGTNTTGGPVEGGEMLISEDTAFDANISADMSCYLRGNGTLTASMHSFNDGPAFASDHSIVYTKTIRSIEPGLMIRANKIYFTADPSIIADRAGAADNQPGILSANNIYFRKNITITNIGDSYSLQFRPLSGSACVVFFDNITVNISYYDSSNILRNASRNINGLYRFTNTYNYLFDIQRDPGGVTFQWADLEALKITNKPDITDALEMFDPYIARSWELGILNVRSGRYEGWAVDNGSLSASNGDSFTEALSFLKPPAANNNENLVILYANSFSNIFDNDPLVYSAKQIRLTSSMSDDPGGLTVPANKQIKFRTDLFSYYGDDIIDGGENNEFIVESLNGEQVVPLYFEAPTLIGANSFPAGYTLLASGTDLMDDSVAATITQVDIPTDSQSLALNEQTIVFKDDVLIFDKQVYVDAIGPTSITIDANNVVLNGPGGVGANAGDLTFTPKDSNTPITLYIAKDLVVTFCKKMEVTHTFVIKAGFYLISTQIKFSQLEGRDAETTEPPPGTPPETYQGITLMTGTINYESTPIAPIFSAPGVTIPYSSFTPEPAEMGGFYR